MTVVRTEEGADPHGAWTGVIGIILAVLVIASVVALQALFYKVQDEEVQRKVVNARIDDLARIRLDPRIETPNAFEGDVHRLLFKSLRIAHRLRDGVDPAIDHLAQKIGPVDLADLAHGIEYENGLRRCGVRRPRDATKTNGASRGQ